MDGATTRIAEQVHSDRAARTRAELDGLTVDRLTEITDKNLRKRVRDAQRAVEGARQAAEDRSGETVD